MINALTVCINYSDYLSCILSNSQIFDSWTIITIPEDEGTISLCRENNIHYCFTSRIYECGPFCKGKAINDGIMQLEGPLDWLCVVDADTFLFPTLKDIISESHLNKDHLYGLYGRLCVRSMKEIEEIDPDKVESRLEHVGLVPGFFHLWHSSIRPYYFEESSHAGLDDILMRDSYEGRVKILPAYCVHIGELWVNHKGRV